MSPMTSIGVALYGGVLVSFVWGALRIFAEIKRARVELACARRELQVQREQIRILEALVRAQRIVGAAEQRRGLS